MKLATATKVRVAHAIYVGVTGARRLVGRSSDSVVCRRDGLVWALDLKEGIQLSIYVFGAFERATARALRRLLPPGGVAIDIGANIGAHTLGMAKHVGRGGRVIAIEPTLHAVSSLRRNLELNPELMEVVTVRAMGLVAPGESLDAEYYAAWPVSTSERRHAIHRGVPLHATGSIARTFDELIAQEKLTRLDVAKIDVDGSEMRVLLGATAALSTLRPSLVIELAPYALEERGDSLPELVRLLSNAGYRFVDERSFTPLPADPAALTDLIPDGGSINIVAVPVERSLA